VLTTLLLTLLHLLVFVYWLGGDLGAFCASYYATDARRSVAERALALGMVNSVDTAPTVALVLMLPSGLALATARGWLAWPWSCTLVVGLASVAWLCIALRVHRSPGRATAQLARIDHAVRVALILALIVAGGAGVIAAAGAALPFPPPPLFVAIKLWLLAACTALGLAIRGPLRAFVAAFGELARSGSTPALESALRTSMAECRRFVLAIWACLLAAAAIGLSKPL
jgi:hypothetical protein